MSIYKNLLFLHGDLIDPAFADAAVSYAEGYGNRVASRRFFASFGRARGAGRTAPDDRGPSR